MPQRGRAHELLDASNTNKNSFVSVPSSTCQNQMGQGVFLDKYLEIMFIKSQKMQ